MDIRVDEQLWANSMAPEGQLLRWRVGDGEEIAGGQTIAEVLIEDCLHVISAPDAGQLTQMVPDGGLIEPGALIACVAA